MADESLVTELTIDSSGAIQGAQDFTQAVGGVVDSSEAAAKATDDLGTSIDTVTTTVQASARQISQQEAALRSQSAAAGGTAAAMLSLGKTTQQLSDAQSAVTRLMAAGVLTVQQAEAEIAKLAARQTDAAAAAKLLQSGEASLADVQKQFPTLFAASSKAASDLEESHSALSGGAAKLAHSLRAISDELNAGVPLFQALRLESGRLTEALGLTSALFNPFTIGLVAVGAALFLVATRAAQTEDNIRSFNVELATFGNGTGATSQGLQALVVQLRDAGDSAADAKKAIDEIISTPGINQSPAVVGQITTLATNLSALQGNSVSDEVKSIVEALSGGVDATIKFGESLGALSADEIDNIRQMALHGQAAQALTLAFDLIAQHVPAAADSFSPFHKAIIALIADWNDLIDTLANSNIAAGLIEQLQGVVAGISDAVKEIESVIALAQNVIATLRQQAPASDLAAAAGAQAGVSLPTPANNNVPATEWGPVAQAIGSAIANLYSNTNFAAGLGTVGQSMFGSTPSPSVSGFGVGGASVSAITAASTIAPIVTSVLSDFQGGSLIGNSGLKSLVSAVIQAESGGNPNAVSSAGAQGLMQLMPGTAASLGVTNPFDATQNVQGGTQYLSQLITQFGTVAAGLAAYNLGPEKYQQYQNSGQALPSSVQNYVQGITSNAGLTGNETAADLGIAPSTTNAGASANVTVPTPAQIASVKQYADETNQAIANDKLWGVAQQAAVAATQARTEAVAKGLTGDQLDQYVQIATNKVYQENADQLAKLNTLTDMQTKSTLATAQAYGVSEVDGLIAAAKATATLQSAEEGRNKVLGESAQDADVTQREQQILDQNAAAAIEAGAKQVAATDATVEANQRLAAAAEISVSAEHDQEIQNQATALTHNALTDAVAANTAAIASGNPVEIARTAALVQQAQALTSVAKAQITANAAAQESTQLSNATHTLDDQGAQLQLQLSLQGDTTQEISKQVDLLKAQQLIENQMPDAAQSVKDAYVDQVAAVADLTNQLALASQAQSRLNDGIKSIGDTIDQSLTSSIQNAFSGQTVTNWAQTIKTAIAQIGTQLLDLALIKPAIGSVLSLLGLTQASQQFGTFSTLLSSIGNLFNGGETSSSTGGSDQNFAGGTPGEGGSSGFSTSDVLQAGGLLKSLFGASGDGSGGLFSGLSDAFSSVTSAVNDFGSALGFAPNIATATDFSGGAAGGLFGSTTLTGALGGVGLGFGAGSLLNSLIGGNQTGGTIGSGVGSLSGALIGSIIPGIGTVIGGLLGGLLGGAGGGLLGGGSHNQTSNANISSTGQFSVSGGTSQTESQTNQILSQLAPIVAGLAAAGLNVPTIGADVGSKAGIETGISGPGISDETHYATTAAAVAGTLQQLTTSLVQLNPQLGITGDTLSHVLHGITDPSQIAGALQFAHVYDNLNSSFSDLAQTFSSIDPSDFASAFSSLQSTFQSLYTQANTADLPIGRITDEFASLTQVLNSSELQTLGTSVTQLTNNSAATLSDYATAFQNLQASLQQLYAQANATNQSIIPITLSFRGLASQLINDGELPTALTSLEASFSSLQPGQYAAALQTVNTTFAAIAAQAQAAGISASQVTVYQKSTQQALAQSFNSQISDLMLQITDPVAYAIQQEKEAGAARLADAKAVGANLTEINAYNALSLKNVTAAAEAATTANNGLASALQSLSDALGSLQTGADSGLDAADQARAAYRTFENTYAEAAKGVVSAINDLGAQGTAVVQAYEAAYGNGGFTPAARSLVVGQETQISNAAGAAVKPNYSYASGTEDTMPGPILVGEQGPEVLIQKGGNQVIPHQQLMANAANSNMPSPNAWGAGAINISAPIVAELSKQTPKLTAIGNDIARMKTEIVNLKTQLRGGQIQAHSDASAGNKTLSGVRQDMARPGVPARRKVA